MSQKTGWIQKLIAFTQEYGVFITMFGMLASILLCLLQLILSVDNMLLLILALFLAGLVMLGGGAWETFVNRLWSVVFVGMMLIGAAALALAYFLSFEPNSPVSAKFRTLYRPEIQPLESQDLKISLDITPTQYMPGERGTITMRFDNHCEYTLVFESVMLETQKRFFEGFVIDYESASPPISQRKNKMGISTALFFGELPIVIPPGETYTVRLEIIANIPGDYSDEFFITPFMDLQRTEAVSVSFPSYSEKIFLVILPEKSAYGVCSRAERYIAGAAGGRF